MRKSSSSDCGYVRFSAKRLGSIGAVALLVAWCSLGCKTGPDYRRPEIGTPPGWNQPVAEGESLAALKWQDVFRDPALAGLISAALENNKDVRIAAARVEQAQANYRGQRAPLLPWLNGSAGWARGRSGITGQTSGQFDVFGALSYEIDFWGRLRRLSEAARAQLLGSEEASKSVYIGLIAEVAAAYYRLLAFDEQLAIAHRTYRSRTNSLELTRIKYDDNNGIVSELDVRQAETQVHTARGSIAQLERSLVVTENALSFLLGRNPGPVARGNLVAQELPAAVSPGLPATLLLRRPDIVSAEHQLMAANANIGAARAAYFPSISLTAALGLQSLELEDLLTSGSSRAWNFAPQVLGPIFNGGRIRAGVHLAEARQQELLAAYEQAIQNAFREVEDSLVTVSKLRDQIAAGQGNVEAERRRLELSLDRYENGVSSYFEVLDAERSLFASELNLVQDRSDLLTAVTQLYRALGGGWESLPNQ